MSNSDGFGESGERSDLHPKIKTGSRATGAYQAHLTHGHARALPRAARNSTTERGCPASRPGRSTIYNSHKPATTSAAHHIQVGRCLLQSCGCFNTANAATHPAAAAARQPAAMVKSVT